jgi:DNA repair exonuclease SbcCD ATPase subunit
MRADGSSDELQQQLLEKDKTIAALLAKIRELEKERENAAAAAASQVAALQSKLQATHEGFVAAESVIKRQEQQITMLQAQVRGQAPSEEPQDTSAEADTNAKPTAREIAAAHVEQGMLWIDPWVTRGERIGQVRQMCTAGVRPQLMEVARQGKQALLTGIVNLREQIETTDDPKEKEALSFFRDFTDEVIKRA